MKSRLLRIGHKLSSLYAATIFGLSGAAFATGNLLLARVLPVAEFGSFALALSVFYVFYLLTPIGLDQLVLRHAIPPGRRLLSYVLLSGTAMGSVAALGAMLDGFLDPVEAIMLALAICAGGVVVISSSGLRTQNRTGAALVIITGGNWVLLAIGFFALMEPTLNVRQAMTLFSLGQIAIGAIAWVMVSARSRGDDLVQISWQETGSLLAIAAVGTISLQLERLMVAPILGISEVALFSVLASVAIFPFRMATSGINFTLVPRLKAATDMPTRRRLIRQEIVAICFALIFASAVVVLMAPMVASWLTADRYQLGIPLVAAACANGSAKVVQAIPRAILTVCGSARDLSYLSVLAWIGLGAAVLGGTLGACWGLTGLITGVAAGSLMINILGLFAANKALKREGS